MESRREAEKRKREARERDRWAVGFGPGSVTIDASCCVVLDMGDARYTVTNVDALIRAAEAAVTMVAVFEEQEAAARATAPAPIRWSA